MKRIKYLGSSRPVIQGRVELEGGGLARLLSFTERKSGSTKTYQQIVVTRIPEQVEIPFERTSYDGKTPVSDYFERLRDTPNMDTVYAIKEEVENLQEEPFV